MRQTIAAITRLEPESCCSISGLAMCLVGTWDHRNEEPVICIVLVHGRRVENGYAMNSKLIIVAIVLGIAGTNAAHARDVTSDPDAKVTS